MTTLPPRRSAHPLSEEDHVILKAHLYYEHRPSLRPRSEPAPGFSRPKVSKLLAEAKSGAW